MDEGTSVQKLSVKDLIEKTSNNNGEFDLTVLAGRDGFQREIVSEEINRPGLALANFFEHFAYQRVQVLGRGEVSYIKKLVSENKIDILEKFFAYEIPLCIITYGMDIPEIVIDICNKLKVPLIRTNKPTREFISLFSAFLSDFFSPFIIKHGDFVSIYNIGVLITGKSGIGKSEAVLGLIERGHRFICDDLVKIKKVRKAKGFELVGEPGSTYGPFLEIRGIGIINVSQYFGEGKILKSEKLELIVNLHEWNSSYNYDRLGLEERYEEIMGIKVPKKEVPVSPGRNVALLIEVAAYREIMLRMGYNSARELDRRILDFLKKSKDI
ncbi:MAG: HPr(Ser) kinase/phosphatase [Brevinematia bacterium]